MNVLACIFFVCNFAFSKNYTFDASSEVLKLKAQNFLFSQQSQEFTPYLADQFIKSASVNAQHLIHGYTWDPATQTVHFQTISALPISEINWIDSESRSEIKLQRIISSLAINKVLTTRLETVIKSQIKSHFEKEGYTLREIQIQSQPIEDETKLSLSIEVKFDRVSYMNGISFLPPGLPIEPKLKRGVQRFLGTRFSKAQQEKIESTLEKILQSEGYWLSTPRLSSVSPDGIVTFEILSPIQVKVTIKGNKAFSKNTFLGGTGAQTRIYGAVIQNIESELKTRIKQKYLEEGFSRAKVSSSFAKSDESTVEIQIEVEEGPRVRVYEIEIEGNISREASYYRNLLYQFSTKIFKEGYYNIAQANEAAADLARHLRNQGFFKAKVSSLRARYNERKDAVTLTLDIDEGPLTTVDSIQFSGVESFELDELIQETGLTKGDPLRIDELEGSLKRIERFYQDRGFIEMRYEHRAQDFVRYNTADTTASLHYKIYEGPKVTVEEIIIDGTSLTKDFVIFTELEFKKGDILTPNLISESIGRLQQLGLFSTVEIRTLEADSEVSARTVIVRVTERDPGLFNFGIGFSSQNDLSLRGFVGASYRNLEGRARTFSSRLELNSVLTNESRNFVENRFNLGFVEPYLLNSRTRGRIAFNRSERINELDRAQFIQSNAALFSLEQFITRRFLFSWEIYRLSSFATFDFERDQIGSTDIIASTGPIIEYDLRNHRFNPTEGNFSRATVEYADPFLGGSPDIHFVRATALHSRYIPLTSSHKWSWANSLQLGYLENLSQRPNGAIPYSRKGFFLGDRTTLRGFAPRSGEQIPNDRDLGINRGQEFFLRTNASFVVVKTELRFPIYESFGGALFYDGGRLDIAGLDFKDPWRDAVGLGLRVATPVGPINIEVGFKLDQDIERGESPYQLHFSIGSF